MTIEEELVEYLTYILEIPSEKISKIISVFKEQVKL